MECLIAVIIGLLVMEKLHHVLDNRAHAAERERLYTRLQAGTLQDYAALRAEAEHGPVVRSSVVEPQERDCERGSVVAEALGPAAMAEAIADFDRLMGRQTDGG